VEPQTGRQRTPSDLAGLVLTRQVRRSPGDKPAWDVRVATAEISSAVAALGPATRNRHNEVLWLKTLLKEKTIRVEKKKRIRKFPLLDLVRDAARSRKRPWVAASEPIDLVERFPVDAADDAYWW